MAGFTPANDLDAILTRMVTPAVEQIAHEVRDEARRLAPPTKEWVTMADERVRETHVEAHGQVVPGNLRFVLTTMEWDRQHRALGDHTYMLQPRDESSRAVANIKQCRCRAATHTDGIAKLIDAGQPIANPGKVTVKVTADGDWVVQAETGTAYPDGIDTAEGTYYMSRAAANVAARLRARR